jgi:hypothetical protein
VPGWTRWAPAEALLKTMRAQQAQSVGSGAGQPRVDPSTANLSPADRERLFQEFQTWQQRQQNTGQQR